MRRTTRWTAGALLAAAIGVLAGCGNLLEVGTCPDGMIYVPAGAFRYGEKATTKRKTSEDIGAFCIDTYEFPNRAGITPLTDVTWMEAASQCAAAGKRLCTEYEWEKSCRGKGGSRYAWGRAFLETSCPGSTDADSGYVSGANDACVSRFGVRDMSGSVWEWTANSFDGDPLRRVQRGGWDASVGELSARCSYRRDAEAAGSASNVGFRCCASPVVVPLTGVGYGP